MKRLRAMDSSHLKQDIGLLGFLICVFSVIVCMFIAEGAEKSECMLMFLALCVPVLFCAFEMPLIAYSLTGLQVLVYAVYKLYHWAIWGERIAGVAYVWLVLPIISIAAMQLFISGTAQLERKNELLREQVEELVIIDPLTGLYNLRGLLNELTRQMARTKRNLEKIVLMEIRLKYEQELRSILTASQFQQLRQRMAELIEDSLRIEDRVFAVDQNGTLAVLLNCDREGASIVERRLRAAIQEKESFRGIVDQAIKVEVKMGYVEYDAETMGSAMDFFKRAETELQYDV